MPQTLLDQIIDAATWGTQPTPNLLRGVIVLGARLQHKATSDWAQGELSGYGEARFLPVYRRNYKVKVEAEWGGMFGDGIQEFDPTLVSYYAEDDFRYSFRQKVAELEALRRRGNDLRERWPEETVREYADQVTAPRYREQFLAHVYKVIDISIVDGVLDNIRTYALRLAAELQSVDQNIGEASGPTIGQSREAEQIVNNFINHINAGNVNLSQGEHFTQDNSNQNHQAQLIINELKTKHRLTDQEAGQLVEAARQDGGKIGDHVRGWVGKVREGVITLTSGAAAEQVVETLRQALEQFPLI